MCNVLIGAAPWVVPFVRPPSFAGRETQLAQLQAHISLAGGRRLAIYGLGGCGKTALALDSAYRTREQQPAHAVFWVPAVSRESFEQAYRDIGMLLRIPGISDDNASVKRLVKTWLSDDGFGPWLMVVDNADDVNVLLDPLEAETSKDRLVDFLPCSRHGSVVFTTRTRNAAIDLAGGTVMQLGELTEEEAGEVLRTRLLPDNQHLLENDQVVHTFLDILAFLPLAIVQATAFINKNNITLADYMSVYRDSEEDAIELLSKDFEDHGRYRDTKNPVATTWYISFKQIRKQNPLAADYLSFMACTTGENIPRSLLLPGSSRLAAMEAVGTLDAYAFVTERRQQQGGREVQHQERMFDMHRLVRLAMHNWLREYQQWNAWVNKTLTRLVEVVPYGGHERREVWTAYLPHALHVAELTEVYEVEGRVLLLDRLGCCEQSLGRYNSAEAAHRKALERREGLLEKEHPHTLTSMNNVARALSDQGKYIEAETMHQETLALREKVLGKEHPDTLTSMNEVALALSKQGKYTEAETMHRETLTLREKVSGKEHPDTLTSMNNVALALSNQGKYIEAEMMHRETLALSEKVLGKEHPDTLISMNEVALALSKQGKYTEAETIHRETLTLREKVSGKEHPHTLTSMNNVALALSDHGKYIEAETIHQETLALREKVSGEEHPDTLTSMSNVANALSNQGKYTEAETMHRETLALREKVLGKEHPVTLTSMNNVALALSDQGKYIEAETMHQETLALSEKVLGKEHPDTLTSMSNVANAPSDQGKYTEAETMHRETLALREKVSGKEHPDTLTSVYCLAYSLHRQQQYEDALSLYHRAYIGYKEKLGPSHGTTQACLKHYSSLRQLCGLDLSDAG
jgi:tetratricopeptide (TPR) repeat protein